ncbi:MAG: glycosyltransferase family 39 protein, partial [Candidatus Kerfeldbacteria bacterium]|nr:glycosyltransferase family 39 protein [Candidatus Kerfeldbacteria bacterium]
MTTKQNTTIVTSTGVLFIVGLALRLYLLALPYWFDEANTIYYISQNFDRMIQFIQHDYSPPLYYLLLWLWVNIFGSNEVVTGLFSFIINLLSVIVLYVFALTLANKRVALMASLLFWLNSASVYYATETRMYSLVTLLGLLSCLFFWQLTQKPKWYYWVGYYLATLAGVYTHNTFFFLLVGQNFVWALMRWQYSNQQVSSKRWLAVQVLLFLGYLGWLPTFLQQLSSNSQGAVYWTDYAAWKGILAVPEILFASINNFGFPIASLTIAVLISFVVYHFFVTNRYADSKLNQVKVFLSVLILVPLAVAYLADILMPKFIVFVFPLFVVILAMSIDSVRFDFFKKYIILAAFLFSSSLVLFTNNLSLQESDLGFMMPKVANYFAAKKNTGNAVILFNG